MQLEGRCYPFSEREKMFTPNDKLIKLLPMKPEKLNDIEELAALW